MADRDSLQVANKELEQTRNELLRTRARQEESEQRMQALRQQMEDISHKLQDAVGVSELIQSPAEFRQADFVGAHRHMRSDRRK